MKVYGLYINPLTFWNYVKNVARVKILKDKDVDPLFFAIYPTYRCNMRCSYCDFWKIKTKELDTKTWFRIMNDIKKYGHSLSITGGEPLIRDDIIFLVREARRLGFAPIIFPTNSLLLPKREKILNHLTNLIISLNTLNENVNDRIVRVKNATKKIKENIVKYSKLQDKLDFVLDVNCVITEQNLSEVSALMEFVFENNARFSVSAQQETSGPSSALRNNIEYRDLIDYIINTKKKEKLMVTSFTYLKHIRDFSPIVCHPFLIHRINPDGSIYYPCNHIGKIIGNLSQEPFEKIKERIPEHMRLFEKCTEANCYISSYLQLSDWTEHPADLIREMLFY